MPKKINKPVTAGILNKALKKTEGRFFKALEDQSKTIIEAVNFQFEKNKKEHQAMRGDIKGIKTDIRDVRSKLDSLERRIIYIEDVITKQSKEIKNIKIILAKHTKEIKEIKIIIKEFRDKEAIKIGELILLEKRVSQLEAKMGL